MNLKTVFHHVDEDVSEIEIECSCGVEILKISKWTNEDDYFISYYLHQPSRSIWRQIIWRIKTAVMVLRGKEYNLFEMVLDGKNIKELAKQLNEFLKARDE